MGGVSVLTPRDAAVLEVRRALAIGAPPEILVDIVLAYLADPTPQMLEASWTVTRNATSEERIIAEMSGSRAAHIHKTKKRYMAMIRAAVGE